MPLKWTKSRPVSFARSVNHSPVGVPAAAAGVVSSTRLHAGASIISPITTHRGTKTPRFILEERTKETPNSQLPERDLGIGGWELGVGSWEFAYDLPAYNLIKAGRTRTGYCPLKQR